VAANSQNFVILACFVLTQYSSVRYRRTDWRQTGGHFLR